MRRKERPGTGEVLQKMADDGDDETTSDPDRGSAKMPGLRARPRPDQRPQAQAVVSSACRYKQAEITPANRFVVAKSSSRQAEVRFDYRRRVWHILHQHHLPATAEVDATASRDHCRWEEGRTSPTCSDSHGGGVPLDKTTGCDDGTGSDSAPPWRKDGEDVINSATCGSSTRQRNVEVR